MKKLLFLLLAVAAFSCKKEESAYESKVVGDWELRKTANSVADVVYFPQGNGQVLRFRNNGTYEKLLADSVYESGSYTLTVSNVAGEWILTLITPPVTLNELVKITEKQLIFRREVDCCNYLETMYEKL